MQAVDQGVYTAAGRSRTPWIEHKEDWVTPASTHDVRQTWENVVNHHLGLALLGSDPGARSELAVCNDTRFSGRIRSGRFGRMRYSRVQASASRAVQRCGAPGPSCHALALVFSGTLHMENRHMAIDVRPGEFVLVKDRHHYVAEQEQDVETLILFDPLTQAQVDSFGTDVLVHRGGRSDAAAMLSRWLQDACADRGLRSDLAAESFAQVVQALACEVMHEQPLVARTRLDRRAIEHEVEQRLDDPHLSLQDLADSFHCSIRTLHRVFRRDGEESLERYIQRQRVEACARLLRTELPPEAPGSLTDLALQFGFSSSSHFSNAFRARFGVSPSVYRRGTAPT